MLDPQQRNRVQVIADIEATAPDRWPHAGLLEPAGRHRFAVHRSRSRIRRSTDPPACSPQGQHYPVIRSAPLGFRRAVEQPARVDHSPGRAGGSLQSGIQRRKRTRVQGDARQRAARQRASARDGAGGAGIDGGSPRTPPPRCSGAATDVAGQSSERAAPNFESAVANIRRLTENLAKTSDALGSICDRQRAGAVALHASEPAGIRTAAAREPPGGARFSGPVAEPEAKSVAAHL